MTPEERSLLERTYELAKENNEILATMRRRGRISFTLRVCYWVLIIAISLGAFYFIQPYVDMIRGLTGSSQKSTTSTSPSYAQTLEELLR